MQQQKQLAAQPQRQRGQGAAASRPAQQRRPRVVQTHAAAASPAVRSMPLLQTLQNG
jgi:hypothetical protein